MILLGKEYNFDDYDLVEEEDSFQKFFNDFGQIP